MTQYVWSGLGTSSAWGDTGNWSPGGTPGLQDLATFGQNATVTGNDTLGAVDVLDSSSVSFNGTITARGLAGTASSFFVDGGASAYFDSSAHLVVSSDRLTVGMSGAGLVTYDGLQLYTNDTSVGVGSDARGELDLGGGPYGIYWKNSGSVVVGQYGTGTLSVTGSSAGTGSGHTYRSDIELGLIRNGQTQGGNLTVGQYAGSNGTLNVSNTGVGADGTVSIGGLFDAKSHGVAVVNVVDSGVIAASGDFTVNAGSVVMLDDGGVSGNSFEVAKGASITGTGDVSTNTSLINDGQVTASGTLSLSGTISGTGSLGIDGGATLILYDASASQAAIKFLGTDATLELTQAGQVLSGPIQGFQPGDVIEASNVDRVHFVGAKHALELYDGKTAVGSLTLAGNFSGDTFAVSYTGTVGTITLTHAT